MLDDVWVRWFFGALCVIFTMVAIVKITETYVTRNQFVDVYKACIEKFDHETCVKR